MKYEFHVGDYVETTDGDIGYITEVNTACWYCTSSRGPRTEKHTYVIPYGTDADMARVFNRIGQYDFTKTEQSKEIDGLMPNGWRVGVDGDDLITKINELVDAVNELTKEYEDHLEGHRQTER